MFVIAWKRLCACESTHTHTYPSSHINYLSDTIQGVCTCYSRQTHTRTHARTHTHTHPHTHTHTYTHTQIMARFPNNAVVFKVFVELEERYGLSHRVRTHWERMWHGPARNAQVRV